MEKIRIIWVGRNISPWTEITREYSKRINRYIKIGEILIKPSNKRSAALRIEDESIKILSKLENNDTNCVLDREGETISTYTFYKWLFNQLEEKRRRTVFIIGSSDGIGEKVLAKADKILSLSKMVFSYQLSKTILYEQIYRSVCIRYGIDYHRE